LAVKVQRRWEGSPTPDLDLLTSPGINDGYMRIVLRIFVVGKVKGDVISREDVFIRILEENKVLGHQLLNGLVLPDVAVESLAGEVTQILNVDEDPFLGILALLPRFVPRKPRDDIVGWSEQIREALGTGSGGASRGWSWSGVWIIPNRLVKWVGCSS